jgi:hypothetical protein
MAVAATGPMRVEPGSTDIVVSELSGFECPAASRDGVADLAPHSAERE